jgi:site-specific DNA-methyltransferase (adenine-specific)
MKRDLRHCQWEWPYFRPRIEVTDGRYEQLPRNLLLVGDALEQLRALPSGTVDTCITSPPYYLLRDYGVSGQLGLEATVDDWVQQLRGVINEVGRVLKPTGSLWLNLGDSFSRSRRFGAPPKSLLLAPERVLLALSRDGWIVRNKVVWAKPNPMPHSVQDRLNTAHESIFLLVRSSHYYFALDEIRRPHRSKTKPSASRTGKYTSDDRRWAGPLAGSNAGLARAHAEGRTGHWLGANPGDVWHLATAGYRGAHFATFPGQLVVRPLLATCPERICCSCQEPWRRQIEVETLGKRRPTDRDSHRLRYSSRWQVVRRTGALEPTCECRGSSSPGVVLDPFFGSGTVGAVAERHHRDWIGIELNPEYARLAQQRIQLARGNQPAA